MTYGFLAGLLARVPRPCRSSPRRALSTLGTNLWRIGAGPAARSTLGRAAEVGRDIGDADIVARATFGAPRA